MLVGRGNLIGPRGRGVMRSKMCCHPARYVIPEVVQGSGQSNLIGRGNLTGRSNLTGRRAGGVCMWGAFEGIFDVELYRWDAFLSRDVELYRWDVELHRAARCIRDLPKVYQQPPM